MFPVCIVVASVAMFSGISGAAMLVPVFLIGFPLFDVPRLTTVEAIGTSLFLETSGFGTGLYRYLKLRLVDATVAKMLIWVGLPLGVAGALVSAHAPVQALRLGYGVAMIGLAWLLFHEAAERVAASGAVGVPDRGGPPAVSAAGNPASSAAVAVKGDPQPAACIDGVQRRVAAANGQTYEFCARGLRGQQVLSGAGAFFAGLISTGVGEVTMPGLIRRSRFPAAIAAATSTVVVAGTVFGAAFTHMLQLAVEGGLRAIPWNLIVWAVPGAIIGAFIGTALQGRVSAKATRRFFGALFLAIGLTFLLAYTVFLERFG